MLHEQPAIAFKEGEEYEHYCESGFLVFVGKESPHCRMCGKTVQFIDDPTPEQIAFMESWDV